MDEAQELREQAKRYRRMKSSVTDKKTLEVLETMALECERRAREWYDLGKMPKPEDEPN